MIKIELIKRVATAARVMTQNQPGKLSLNDWGYWALNSKTNGTLYFYFSKTEESLFLNTDVFQEFSNNLYRLHLEIFGTELNILTDYEHVETRNFVYVKAKSVYENDRKVYLTETQRLSQELECICIQTEARYGKN